MHVIFSAYLNDRAMNFTSKHSCEPHLMVIQLFVRLAQKNFLQMWTKLFFVVII